MRTSTLILVALFSGPLACASAPVSASSGSRDTISADQIAGTNSSSAYDAVNRLHPDWLRPAALSTGIGGNSSQMVLVYLDGNRMGGIETLRSITASSVTSIQFLTATKAANVIRDMGTGVASPVIAVSTR